MKVLPVMILLITCYAGNLCSKRKRKKENGKKKDMKITKIVIRNESPSKLEYDTPMTPFTTFCEVKQKRNKKKAFFLTPRHIVLMIAKYLTITSSWFTGKVKLDFTTLFEKALKNSQNEENCKHLWKNRICSCLRMTPGFYVIWNVKFSTFATFANFYKKPTNVWKVECDDHCVVFIWTGSSCMAMELSYKPKTRPVIELSKTNCYVRINLMGVSCPSRLYMPSCYALNFSDTDQKDADTFVTTLSTMELKNWEINVE